MGLWNLYFILKLSLYFADLIDFHVWLNFALALALLLTRTLPKPWAWLRNAAALALAVVLFYHDTRFPPFERLIAQTDLLSQFSWNYLSELLGRFINPMVVAGCLGVMLAAQMASRKLRLSSFVLLAIFPVVPLFEYLQHAGPLRGAPMQALAGGDSQSSGIAPPGATGKPDNAALDQALQAFYKTQAGRQIEFPKPGPGPDFDVLILQICSMAWDDLQLAGMADNSPLTRFDLLFRQFNTATAYSGPAAIRLLRATCGQTPHSALYDQAPSSCYLFNQFAAAGFERQMLMNHDGVFGDMLKEIQTYGGLNVQPLDTKGLPTLSLAFDGSVIQDDDAVLDHWLELRKRSPAQRVALFYNTASLHDGNHPVGTRDGANSAAGYAGRLKRLFSDLDLLFNQIEASGRRVVLIMIPEHGADSRGDRMQIPFMRENPSPAITLAPVGVRFFGLPKPAAPIDIPQPASYIDLAGLLRDIIQQNPYASDGPDMRTLASGIGSTPHVAENDGSVVVRYGQDYYIRYKDSAWTEYQYR
ncbi:MAG: cellulose biosynthesis protein BcsG [Perlucidibaca sp.]